jgi:hypothetical protein
LSRSLAWPLTIALPLLGCFTFDAPLGPSSSPIDDRLLGEWRCIPSKHDPEDDRVFRMDFKGLDATHYDVSSPDCVPETDSACSFHYRAHVTHLRRDTVLNALDLDDSGKGMDTWYLALYRFPGRDVLLIQLVDSGQLNGPDTPMALRRALESRNPPKDLLADFVLCKRAASGK